MQRTNPSTAVRRNEPLPAETRWSGSTGARWGTLAVLWLLVLVGLVFVAGNAGLREGWPILAVWLALGAAGAAVAWRTDLGLRADASGIRVLRRVGAVQLPWDAIDRIDISFRLRSGAGASAGVGLVGYVLGGLAGAGIARAGLRQVTRAAIQRRRGDGKRTVEEELRDFAADPGDFGPTLSIRRSGRWFAHSFERPMSWEFVQAIAGAAIERGIDVRIA